MPRLITITLKCDWTDCPEAGDEASDLIKERTVTLDRMGPKKFLLCKEHDEALDAVLIPLIQAGVKVEVPKPKKGAGGAPGGADASGGTGGNGHKQEEFDCLEEGCTRAPLKNRTGMAQHVIRTHGYESLEAYETAHGLAA